MSLRTLLALGLVSLGSCTPDEPAAPPDGYRIVRPAASSDLAWDVIAVMWERVNFYDGPAILENTLRGATPGQRAVYACTWYRSEVNNGGHGQFFSNSTGALWPEALEGFRSLQASAYARNLEEALAVFGEAGPSRDREQRQRQIDAVPGGAWDEMDKAFLALQKRQPLSEIFVRYIGENPSEFFR